MPPKPERRCRYTVISESQPYLRKVAGNREAAWLYKTGLVVLLYRGDWITARSSAEVFAHNDPLPSGSTKKLFYGDEMRN